MFLVKVNESVVGNFIFSEVAEAYHLADSVGGEVVPVAVNPSLSYEETEEKIFRVTFTGEFISMVEVVPMRLDGGVVRLADYAAGNDFVSSDGKEARIYVRAASDDAARMAAMERRWAMRREQAVREREKFATLTGQLSAADRAEVIALLEEGRKASAVKLAREVLACGLREAAQVVAFLDDHRKETPAPSEEGAWGSTCGICGCPDWGHAEGCPGSSR